MSVKPMETKRLSPLAVSSITTIFLDKIPVASCANSNTLEQNGRHLEEDW